MLPMPKHVRIMRWLAGPFILLAVILGIVYGRFPLAVLAMTIAALPGMYSVEIPYGKGPTPYGLRAALLLVSTIGIAAILWGQHSSLPAWLVILAAIYAILGLMPAAFNIALVMKPELRQSLYQRRLQRRS